MSKLEQVLTIEPQNELRFRGPFNSPVTSYMKLTNPSEKRVLFKIKTTAPKKYCVRPNSGILEPNSQTEIAISLQPFLFDPAEKNKHKFMVQTLFAPDGDVNLEQLWREITPEQLMDSKLKCVFEMPVEQNENHEPPKASPKVELVPNSNAVDPELQKAAEEVNILRQGTSALRLENLELKEEIISLRNEVRPTARYQPKTYNTNVQHLMLTVAIIAGVLGVLLGKYIL